MTTPTPTGAAELPKCTAADGSTEVINVPGYPLMVRAVDFNRLRAKAEELSAAQADSQPAPANTRQIAECYGDCPEDPKTCANPCKFEGRAARAPADSVLEDAARYRWLTGDHHKHEVRAMVYEIATSMNVRGKGSVDAAIDAARKQGANHD